MSSFRTKSRGCKGENSNGLVSTRSYLSFVSIAAIPILPSFSSSLDHLHLDDFSAICVLLIDSLAQGLVIHYVV